VPWVELGRGTSGTRKETGDRMEVVTPFRDLEDIERGIGKGEAVTLNAVVVV
jgi:hypothetical protein